MSLAESIDARVRAASSGPQIVLGTIDSISSNSVKVSGIADQAIACDWLGAFQMEIDAKGAAALVGKRVEVHYPASSDGTKQPVVASTIVVGEK